MPKVIKGLVLIALGALLITGLASRASAEEKNYPGQVLTVNKALRTAEIAVTMDENTVVKEKITNSSVRIRKYGQEVPVEDLVKDELLSVKYQVARDGKKTLVEIEVIMHEE